METTETEWADGAAGVCCSVNEDYTDPKKKTPKPRDPRVSTRIQGWWWGRDCRLSAACTEQGRREGIRVSCGGTTRGCTLYLQRVHSERSQWSFHEPAWNQTSTVGLRKGG